MSWELNLAISIALLVLAVSAVVACKLCLTRPGLKRAVEFFIGVPGEAGLVILAISATVFAGVTGILAGVGHEGAKATSALVTGTVRHVSVTPSFGLLVGSEFAFPDVRGNCNDASFSGPTTMTVLGRQKSDHQEFYVRLTAGDCLLQGLVSQRNLWLLLLPSGHSGHLEAMPAVEPFGQAKP